MIAGRATPFSCVTSGGLPAASIRWYKDTGNPDSTDDTILTGATSAITSVNGIQVTTSTLIYTPAIQDDSMRVFCVADVFTSSQPTLNVQCKLSIT